MGMFSEICAQGEAERLEKALKVAMESQEEVKIYAKKEIYPLYKSACSEAWMAMNQEIVEFFSEETK